MKKYFIAAALAFTVATTVVAEPRTFYSEVTCNSDNRIAFDLVEKKHGKLICKGRKDHLVKVRGYRIEIPFVEAKLRAIKMIEQCVVIEKKTRNYDNYLAAVIKPVNKKISDFDLKKAALKELPQYMIPAQFILVKNIPLSIIRI